MPIEPLSEIEYVLVGECKWQTDFRGSFISNLFMEDMFVPEEFSTKANQDEIKA